MERPIKYYQYGEDHKYYPADPHDATHVMLTVEDYNALRDPASEAEMGRLVACVGDRVYTRIDRERANADRGIIPKKGRSGYLVLSTVQRDQSCRSDRGYPSAMRCWETVVQTPYDASWAADYVMGHLTLHDNPVYTYVGITAATKDGKGGYKEYAQEMQNLSSRTSMPLYAREHLPPIPYTAEDNVLLDYHLRLNLRAGYWEVTYLHTHPIIVPEDMIPPRG